MHEHYRTNRAIIKLLDKVKGEVHTVKRVSDHWYFFK